MGDPINKLDPEGNSFESFFRAVVNAFSGGSALESRSMSNKTAEAKARDVGRKISQETRSQAQSAARQAGKVVKLAVVDTDVLLDGELTWEDAVEVAGAIPAGKIAVKTGKRVWKAVEGARIVCSFEGSTLDLSKTGKTRRKSRLTSSNTSLAFKSRAGNSEFSAGNHLWSSNNGPLKMST